MRSVVPLILILLLATSLAAGVPPMISYQGKLMQPSGAPVPDGTYSMQFAIYDVPTGGTPLWSETNPSVQVKGGLFAVLLGSINNLPANIFDNPNRFFGVKVGSDPEMTPRQQIASVAYAQMAAVAQTVEDGAITTAKIADASVTTAKVADGAVTAGKAPFALAGPWGRARMQAGYASTGTASHVDVTFPTPFSTPPIVVVQPEYNWSSDVMCTVSEVTASKFHVWFTTSSGNARNLQGFYWMAIQ